MLLGPQVSTIECFTLCVGISFLVAGNMTSRGRRNSYIRFASHRFLHALYSIFHVLPLSNINVAV